MKLEEYIAKFHNSNRSEFCKVANILPMNVSRYISGQRKPDTANLEKIRRATGGLVDFQDFFTEAQAS